MTVRILHGDCRRLLKTLPDDSVHCCVTSPPYWGLRSYLPDDHPDKKLEIGSEPTLQAWVQTMVEVFREVRRVLRPDGTLWLNLGDAYAGSRCGGSDWPGSTLNGKQPDHSRVARATHQAFTEDHKASSAAAKRIQRMSRANGGGPQNANLEVPRSDVKVPGLKPKDLMGQPWRVAFALQADGWWLRQEIIWHKPNPMPESMRDRCTKAHEHVFLLSKSEEYFYDFDAMQEPASPDSHARYARGRSDSHKHAGASPVPGSHPQTIAQGFEHMRDRTPSGWDTGPGGHRAKAGRYRGNGVGFGHGFDKDPKPRVVGVAGDGAYSDGKSDRLGRGPGWRKAFEAPAGAKSNASFDAAMADLVSTRNRRSVWTIPTHGFKGAHFATFPPALAGVCIAAGCPPDGTVLDPFGGSGTVGLEADRQHKHAILIDLDERNVPMATDRITGDATLFAQVEVA